MCASRACNGFMFAIKESIRCHEFRLCSGSDDDYCCSFFFKKKGNPLVLL